MKAGIKLQRLEQKARNNNDGFSKTKICDNKYLMVYFLFKGSDSPCYLFISNGVETDIDYSQAFDLLNGGL
jgi:hypothetical protein